MPTPFTSELPRPKSLDEFAEIKLDVIKQKGKMRIPIVK